MLNPKLLSFWFIFLKPVNFRSLLVDYIFSCDFNLLSSVCFLALSMIFLHSVSVVILFVLERLSAPRQAYFFSNNFSEIFNVQFQLKLCTIYSVKIFGENTIKVDFDGLFDCVLTWFRSRQRITKNFQSLYSQLFVNFNDDGLSTRFVFKCKKCSLRFSVPNVQLFYHLVISSERCMVSARLERSGLHFSKTLMSNVVSLSAASYLDTKCNFKHFSRCWFGMREMRYRRQCFPFHFSRY